VLAADANRAAGPKPQRDRLPTDSDAARELGLGPPSRFEQGGQCLDVHRYSLDLQIVTSACRILLIDDMSSRLDTDRRSVRSGSQAQAEG